MLNIDGDQISIAIDLDQGARLASLQWRDMQFVVPFNGDVLRWGWYGMAPWAGRIKDGLDKLTDERLTLMLDRAARAAAITVSRTGARPPGRDEI